MGIKLKIKFLSILYILSLVISTIIKDGYHFFDVFYYRDLYKSYIKQKKNNKCSIDDGPNCFFIKSKNESDISKELKNIFPDNNSLENETLEDIYFKLKSSTKLISEKESSSTSTASIDDEVFSLDSPYVMSLLLSFESYDEKTINGDIYAPETIDTPFELGRVTLTILGKLRLSQKDSKKYELPMASSVERPRGSYAFVESKEVVIKFNLKSTVGSLFIKKNKYNQNNKTFYLYGYKNGNRHVISKIQNVPSSQWIRINGDGKKYDSIVLIRGFDFDNILINSSAEGLINYNQITKKFSSVINEKLSNVINEAVSNIKEGKKNSNKNIIDKGPIKVIKINLNQEDIAENNEEDFEIPEDILNEIEKLNAGKKQEKNNNDNNANKKNLNEDL
jgi:hypothetical protein